MGLGFLAPGYWRLAAGLLSLVTGCLSLARPVARSLKKQGVVNYLRDPTLGGAVDFELSF